ncbi:hypothetical protein INS49_012972 [Diaporthe citri]|uniref:uncharacterized protein n=1 Tax=Diaporthe citri TaxID=83186 RepID=UPI001C81F10C|nr:uncharacterized protein INS49_012972 [Diaporthe citri]KAG6359451.1 hypothetical protein INS49_012972 [Diaporthe citri]
MSFGPEAARALESILLSKNAPLGGDNLNSSGERPTSPQRTDPREIVNHGPSIPNMTKHSW